ncbi:YciI family protein [Planomonospora sp. ID67723]|uniref:YciI family protein n=1 Tax=Planomonospora sp. ID67723 TaxID=2738134 RepID=UPI0018C40C47|nr:YciI family protein [Planomonospora sp. ID67723]MBG0831447.1 YciI family protein [Planomonospora sp. ID67723]
MRYVLLAVGDESPWAEAGPAEREEVYARWGRFDEMLAAGNAGRGGNELASSGTATTVRKAGGKVIVTDGPYAEAVEQIGGYITIEAATMEEAVAFAEACPSDVVEIRPVPDRG